MTFYCFFLFWVSIFIMNINFWVHSLVMFVYIVCLGYKEKTSTHDPYSKLSKYFMLSHMLHLLPEVGGKSLRTFEIQIKVCTGLQVAKLSENILCQSIFHWVWLLLSSFATWFPSAKKTFFWSWPTSGKYIEVQQVKYNYRNSSKNQPNIKGKKLSRSWPTTNKTIFFS